MTEDQAASHAGVRRMNRKPLFILAGGALVVIIVMVYAINNSSPKKAAATKQEDLPVVKADNSGAALEGAIGKQPITEYIPPELGPDVPILYEPAARMGGNNSPQPNNAPQGSNAPQPVVLSRTPAAQTTPAAVDPGAEERKRIRDQKIALLQTALNSPTAVASRSEGMNASQGQGQGQGGQAGAAGIGMQRYDPTAAINDRLDSMTKIGAAAAGGDDPNQQAHKEAFLNKANSGDRFGYLVNARQAPLSPYELKSGSIIPAIIISTVNSDLPGMIIAQVSQNVYDTSSGHYLLIPQGSRLVGSYDSQIAYGQDRVLQVWNKLVFPDGSSLNLGAMAGADQAGASGFADQVNHHFVRIFGSALMVSLFSAGIQLSQPQNNSVTGQLTAQQQIAASLGQQMGELGMEMARKNMQIQPTITIRSGYRFNVMVSKDIVLEPYTEMEPIFPSGRAKN